MIVAPDVQYADPKAHVGLVGFASWEAERPELELGWAVDGVADYEPGQFWRRELPCLQAALAQLPSPPALVIVDGYVDLDPSGRPGLGAHLYAALGGEIPVGVAKTGFRSATHALEVHRNQSSRPLFVTSAGLPASEAAGRVASMAGSYRIPTLLKRVDARARGAEPGCL